MCNKGLCSKIVYLWYGGGYGNEIKIAARLLQKREERGEIFPVWLLAETHKKLSRHIKTVCHSHVPSSSQFIIESNKSSLQHSFELSLSVLCHIDEEDTKLRGHHTNFQNEKWVVHCSSLSILYRRIIRSKKGTL